MPTRSASREVPSSSTGAAAGAVAIGVASIRVTSGGVSRGGAALSTRLVELVVASCVAVAVSVAVATLAAARCRFVGRDGWLPFPPTPIADMFPIADLLIAFRQRSAPRSAPPTERSSVGRRVSCPGLAQRRRPGGQRWRRPHSRGDPPASTGAHRAHRDRDRGTGDRRHGPARHADPGRCGGRDDLAGSVSQSSPPTSRR